MLRWATPASCRRRSPKRFDVSGTLGTAERSRLPNRELCWGPKRNDKPILLNLPQRILEEGDLAVREHGVTRSQFLRQAIERDLRHYQNVSAPSSLGLSAGHELGRAAIAAVSHWEREAKRGGRKQ